MSTSLLTDHYELTMLDAALHSGAASRRCVFETFARSLPPGRRFGVVCGTERLLSAIAAFTFGADELAFLADTGVVSAPCLEWLAEYRFGGNVWGYPEGSLYFPNSPILSVEASFAEAVLLETLVLSVLNYDSAVAAAAARMVHAAEGRTLLEAGGRRAHERAAVAAARAAFVCGFDASSNLAAGQAFGVPTAGTAAHAFMLTHDDEAAAFAAQHDLLGTDSTYLVDTFDVETAIRSAVEVVGPEIGGIRIDSGDLAAQAVTARALLDSLGAHSCHITASGDLDEYSLAELAGAPIDSYLVGTSLVTGSGHPTAGLIYKVVEVDGRPVWKTSPDKATRGGRKAAFRTGAAEVLLSGDARPPDGAVPLQVEFIRDGQPVVELSTLAARAHHSQAFEGLSDVIRMLEPGPPFMEATPL